MAHETRRMRPKGESKWDIRRRTTQGHPLSGIANQIRRQSKEPKRWFTIHCTKGKVKVLAANEVTAQYIAAPIRIQYDLGMPDNVRYGDVEPNTTIMPHVCTVNRPNVTRHEVRRTGDVIVNPSRTGYCSCCNAPRDESYYKRP